MILILHTDLLQQMLGMIGFFTFLPKYFEFVFRQSASDSGFAGGFTKAAVGCIGVFLSGLAVTKW